MDKINELFENELNGVIHAYPSIYTKDDVTELLSKLRTVVLTEAADALSKANSVSITEELFQEFASDVQNNLERSLCNGSIEVYDSSSAEFSINYNNQIELDNLDILADNITDEVHNILLDQFQVHFGKFLTNNPE
jgi:hypothetical protein